MLEVFTHTELRIRDFARAVSRRENGATAVEYGLMVALIAIVIIVAVTFLGNSLSDKFAEVGTTVNNAGG